LTPLSNNPDDFDVLTPFHFLSLRGPKEVTEEDVTTMKSHRSRWQLIQQMSQHHFRRWSRDYLQTLQQRNKWLEPQPNINKDDMVLLHDVDASIGRKQWILGRIEETFPGKDGRVRKCDIRVPILESLDDKAKPKLDDKSKVKMKTYKILRRPITRLSPLPMEEEVASTFTQISI
jgi:hypothetical protein